jgi:hypothetical protein
LTGARGPDRTFRASWSVALSKFAARRDQFARDSATANGKVAPFGREGHEAGQEHGPQPHGPGKPTRECEDQQAEHHQRDGVAKFHVDAQGRLAGKQPESDEGDLNDQGYDDDPDDHEVRDPKALHPVHDLPRNDRRECRS